MSGEITVPLLPCRSIDEQRDSLSGALANATDLEQARTTGDEEQRWAK